MEVKIFGVIGAGQMGNGIAQVAAASGLAVIMIDVAAGIRRQGAEDHRRHPGPQRREGQDDRRGQATPLLGRIRGSDSLEDMAAADVVVEAATEKQEIKFQIFRELDQLCQPEAILATNTSLHLHHAASPPRPSAPTRSSACTS